ncbi:MAG: hypothetical protein WBN97_04320 [Parvibaculum sp.]
MSEIKTAFVMAHKLREAMGAKVHFENARAKLGVLTSCHDSNRCYPLPNK